MCGILALLLADEEAHCRQSLFDGLTVLQHRGQDAAGMTTCRAFNRTEPGRVSAGRNRFKSFKACGLARDVFSTEVMVGLEGNAGIAHCRYPTAGTSSSNEAQPMYTNYPCGLALAHNGNLTNAGALRVAVEHDFRHLNTESDSEVLLNVFAEELRAALDLDDHRGLPITPNTKSRRRIDPEMIFQAAKATMERCKGGYGVVMLIHNVGVVAFRDPWGIRPLVCGRRKSTTMEDGIDYIICSESCAMDTLQFDLIGDVAPGECVIALPMVPNEPRSDEGFLRRQLVGTGSDLSPCIFEYVYFARPDSIMNGVSVYESRLRMGECLAKKIQRVYPRHDIDCVIPVPDTSRTSALQVAKLLCLPYREGFIKNRYIGRTFIMPGQEMRKKNVRLKLNTIRSEFEGRNVLLVDDSIVRGTTSKQLIVMARRAGAKKVYICSAAPEIRHPNVYGIDLPAVTELVAHERTPEEISKEIGADWVLYQDLEDLEWSVRSLNQSIEHFETSTFSGEYVTGDISADYFKALEELRNDNAKLARKNKARGGSFVGVS